MPRAASSARQEAPAPAKKVTHHPTPPPASSRGRIVPCSPGLTKSFGPRHASTGGSAGGARPASRPCGPAAGPVSRKNGLGNAHTSIRPGASATGTPARAASLGQPATDANSVLTSSAGVVVPAYLMGATLGGSGASSFANKATSHLTQTTMTRSIMSANNTGRNLNTTLGGSRGLRVPHAQLDRTVEQSGDAFGGPRSPADPVPATTSHSTTYKVGQAVLNPFVAIAPAVQQSVRGVQASDELPDAARRPLTGAVLAPLQAEVFFPATPATLEDLLHDKSCEKTRLSLGETERQAHERLSPDAQESMLSPVSMPVFTSTMLQYRASATTTSAGAVAAASAVAQPTTTYTTVYSSPSPWSLAAGTTASPNSGIVFPVGVPPSSRTRRAAPETVKLSADFLGLKDALHHAQEMTGTSPFSPVVALPPAQRVDEMGVPLLCAEEIVLDGVSTGGNSRSAASTGEARGVGVLRGLYGTTTRDTTTVRSLRACVAGETATTVLDVLPVLHRAEAKSKELVAARRLVDWNTTIPTSQTVAAPVIAFLDAHGNPVAHRQRFHLLLNSATFELTEAPPTTAAGAEAAAGGISADGGGAALSLGSKLIYEPSGKEGDGGAAAIGQHRLCGLVGLVNGLAERVGVGRVMEYQVRTANADMLLIPPRMVGADLVLRVNPSLQGTIVLHILGFDCAHVSSTTGQVLESTNELICAVTVQYKGTQDGTAETAALDATNSSNNKNDNHGHRDGSAPTSGTAHAATRRHCGESVEDRELLHLQAQRRRSSPHDTTAREVDRGGGGVGVGGSGADDSRFAFPVSNPCELRYPAMRSTARAILAEAYAGRLHARAEAEKAQAQSQQPKHVSSPLHSSTHTLGDDAATGPRGGQLSPQPDESLASGGEGSAQDGALEVSFDPVAGAVPVFGAAGEPNADRQEKPPAASTTASSARGTAAAARANRRRVTLLFTENRPEGSNPPTDLGAHTSSSLAAKNGSPSTGARSSMSPTNDAMGVALAGNTVSRSASEESHEAHELWLLNEDMFTLVAPSGCIQPHGHCLRIAAWQDHISSLFGEDDKKLFDSEARAAFKRHVRHELSDAVLSSLSVGRSCGGSAVLGRSVSGASAGSPTGHHGSMMSGEGAAAAAQSTSESSLALLRRLLLCLMSEENRASVQLYNDVVTVAGHLSSSALLRATACTGGTPESLQRMSAAVLASSSAAGSEQPPRLSEKDRRNLALLVDALDVAMCAMFHVGCLKKAITYGVQRVHALCVREGCMNAVVAAAQRDMAELYLLFGDYALAVRTAEEVLMIAEQLFDADSNEVCSAETLLFLACHEGGYHTRKEELRTRLANSLERLEVAPTASLSFASANNRRTLMAELHLALCIALSPVTFTGFTVSGAEQNSDELHTAINHLYDAVILLRGDGDLADVDKSFSTFATVTTGAASAAVGADPFFRGEEGRQKRRRWSFLGLAAGMLMRLGDYTKGMAVFEALVEELVLGKHRYVERTHRAQIGALSWVNIALWRHSREPAEHADNLVLLRRTVHRLTTIMGPLHPLSATANLALAFVRGQGPSQIATLDKLAIKSLSVIRRQLASRSNLVLTSYRVCNAVCAVNESRWLDLVDHANSALIIAQINHASDEFLMLVEKEFLAALLLSPPTALVRLNNELLCGRLEERLERVTNVYGPQSEVLLTPLENLADACYLLGDLPHALDYIQRAVRLADPKGILFVSAAVLKPAVVLSSSAEVARRDQLVHAVLGSTTRVIRLAELLFALAAILEAGGNATDAQDCYARALALYEAVQLRPSLAAAHIQAALAKLLYSSSQYGEALGWALACERTVHDRYSAWKSEVQRSRMLVKTIEEQLAAKEGSYVMVNTNNTTLDYLELI